MQFFYTDGLRTYIFVGVDIDTVAARRASGDRRDNLYMLISITEHLHLGQVIASEY